MRENRFCSRLPLLLMNSTIFLNLGHPTWPLFWFDEAFRKMHKSVAEGADRAELSASKSRPSTSRLWGLPCFDCSHLRPFFLCYAKETL